MKLDFDIAPEHWVVLPAVFPTLEGLTEEQWFDDFLRPFVLLYGELDDEQLAGFREMIADARSRIHPDDVATLMYRPLNVPVTSLVHLQLFEGEGHDPHDLVRRGLLPTDTLALAPLVEPFDSAGLGAGTKAAFIPSERFSDGTVAGGLSYVFATKGYLVRAITTATSPPIVGLMEPALDEIVNSLSLTEGEVAGVRRRE